MCMCMHVYECVRVRLENITISYHRGRGHTLGNSEWLTAAIWPSHWLLTGSAVPPTQHRYSSHYFQRTEHRPEITDSAGRDAGRGRERKGEREHFAVDKPTTTILTAPLSKTTTGLERKKPQSKKKVQKSRTSPQHVMADNATP